MNYHQILSFLAMKFLYFWLFGPNLEYGDDIFYEAYNKSFHENITFSAQSLISCTSYSWSYKRYFKGKKLPGTSFRISSAQAFVRFLKINLFVIFTSYCLFKPFTTQICLEIYPFVILNTIF